MWPPTEGRPLVDPERGVYAWVGWVRVAQLLLSPSDVSPSLLSAGKQEVRWSE